ncbi:Triacylglycerol lipase [Bertholletia excelsa]
MACQLKLLLLVSITISWLAKFLVHAQSQVPCVFFMGDSLLDNGNNNDLPTSAKANYPPYGIDFPDGPTDRFSNGQNMADVMAKFLGFDISPPPFATARGDILKGINYASGGAGIRDESGQQPGEAISLNRQLLNHQTTVSRFASVLGNKEAADDYLGKCIYIVGMGNNDYLNNYLMTQNYPTSRIYNPDQFADVLIQQYSQQLTRLYGLGARKIAIFGLSLLGCIPAEIATFGTNGPPCVDFINDYVQLFNNRLKPLVDDLNKHLKDAKFIYINVTGIQSGGIPAESGFTVTNSPCCVVGTGKVLCQQNQVPCRNRSAYVFWDAVHPTEIVNILTVSRAYTAFIPSDAYPYDIRTEY